MDHETALTQHAAENVRSVILKCVSHLWRKAVARARPTTSAPGSAAVGRTNAEPVVTHLMIMNSRIVDRRGQTQHLGR